MKIIVAYYVIDKDCVWILRLDAAAKNNVLKRMNRRSIFKTDNVGCIWYESLARQVGIRRQRRGLIHNLIR